MNRLAMWLSMATTQQKQAMAELAHSSVAAIRLASKGYRTHGEVDLTPEFAARIERAVEEVNLADMHSSENFKLGEEYGLVPVRREHLCKACAECPYQKACNAE